MALRKRGARTALAALLLFGIFASTSGPALACSCERVRPANAAFWISEIEVIVEGIVIAHEPVGGNGNAQKSATLAVDQVWKGKLPDLITLSYHENGASCGAVPPLGQHIRISMQQTPQGTYFYGLCSDLFADSRFDALLADYKRRTEAAEREVVGHGTDGQLIFARYLQSNHETHRALELYSSILAEDPDSFKAMVGRAVALGFLDRTDDALKQLDAARAIAPTGDEGRGALARAKFEITGLLEPGWKDWSGLENHGIPPQDRRLDLTGDNFDNARLIALGLTGSSARNASFLGANLMFTALGTDLQGARYDCKTVFMHGFDPQAAGMINVEGACPRD